MTADIKTELEDTLALLRAAADKLNFEAAGALDEINHLKIALIEITKLQDGEMEKARTIANEALSASEKAQA